MIMSAGLFKLIIVICSHIEVDEYLKSDRIRYLITPSYSTCSDKAKARDCNKGAFPESVCKHV
jgi:hypothetical protein